MLNPIGGSGTTAHAVALINAGDSGSRSTITITTNEISAADQMELLAAEH